MSYKPIQKSLILIVIFITFGNLIEIRAGEYAPKEAYLQGSNHPYFGSEAKWNRRFFAKDLYKRRGQRQMLNIVEGRYQEAEQYCRKLLAADRNDLESLYNLTIVHTQMNDLPGAMKTIKRAVQAGLPFARFLAGPRDLLKPLVQTTEFEKFAAIHNVQLIHGPLLGCLTDRSAKFWVRTVDEVGVQVLAGTSNDLRTVIKSDVRRTDSQDDYTAIVEVKGLKPETLYYYDVLLDGKSAMGSRFPSFSTYPKAGKKARFKVGFGGGAGYTVPNERIWDVILSHKPNAFLFLGDNVYIDLPRELCGYHYYTYYRRQSRPEFRRLVSSVSIYAIWDDHDCAINDVWMGPFRDKPSWKMSMLRLFRQNWNNPGYGDPEWPGCWFKFSIADVDFFMLDGRFYRTNPFDKDPTMLGPVQKKWLKQQLKNSKATFKVLASPVPWTFYAKGKALDTWNGFRDERNEIFSFLAESKIDGVVLISADRHRSDAWRIDRDNAYPLYEFESSRLTNLHVHKLQPGALFGYNQKQSFGLLTFDTTRPDPTVTCQIVSIDNELIHTFTLKKSDISHK